jgi:uncharacterized protein (DUF927 family)
MQTSTDNLQTETTEQCQLLGYKDGETVYYRAIADNKPRKLSAKFPANPSELVNLNNDGFNIYLVVNGGGDKDADITTCKAIFYEHDDRPKEDQLFLWQSLELPEPTFQVDTGGKSIHSYWVFDEPIAVDLWKILQTELLNFSKADRTIKNPSRVMRLAGFKHQKTGELSTIVSKSGNRYSYDKLRSLVPPTPVVVKEKKQKPAAEASPKPPIPKATTPSGTAIPLENCLAHSNRDLLRGVSEGGRNDSGATLVRDLISTANYLDSIGTLYIGDARSLFDDFCTRCDPSLDDAEAQTIWDSAQRDNPSPSCPPDAIANILNAWNKENDPNYVAPIEERKLGYYTSPHEGLVLVHKGKDDGEGEPTKVTTKIGNHLEAIAVVDNPEQNQSALLLEFKTFQGHIRRVVILRSDLAGDGTAIISMLMGLGYAFKRKQKAPLLDYLHGLGIGISKKYTVTESTGWVGESFVMPHKTYGDVDLRFRDIDPIPDVITEIKGTLQGWKDNVAAHCAGNSRSILALGSSFAAPLLPIVDVESGGFHLVGATSQGKTTILSIAASVTGLKTVSSWRTTDNALEGGLAASNHLCLPLDELNQADPRKVGSIVYMLGNGIGKGRSTKEGTNRKSKTWLTLVLSSGETTIGKFMELAGEVIKGGQEVRLPNIPAIPENSKYGCFETIHGADTAAQFVAALDAAVKEHRGMALDAFLSRLVVDAVDPTFAGNLSKQVHLIAAKLCEGTKDSAIGRVAKRFALVQVALGLAHKYGLLPFDVEQVGWGVSECFNAWLKARGGDGSIEIKNAVDRIEHLLVINEFSDRVFTLPDNNDRVVRNLLACRKLDFDGQTEEFWVPSSVFDKEFCDGVNKTELVKELQRLGWLIPPRKDGKSTHQRSIKGKAKYYFVFGKRENGSEGSEGSEGNSSNEDGVKVVDPPTSLHYPKITSEGGEGSPPKNDSSLHHLHHPKITSEGSVEGHNHYPASVLDLSSLPSPPSPLKTGTRNPILEKYLKVGDRVKYIGDNKSLQAQYAGALEIFEIKGDSYTCKKPSGSLTSWIELEDLQLAEVA